MPVRSCAWDNDEVATKNRRNEISLMRANYNQKFIINYSANANIHGWSPNTSLNLRS